MSTTQSLITETVLDLKQAAALLGVSPKTVWHWCAYGHHGVKLEHRRLGRKLFTSTQALDRFAVKAELAAPATKPAPIKKPAPPKRPARPNRKRRTKKSRRTNTRR